MYYAYKYYVRVSSTVLRSVLHYIDDDGDDAAAKDELDVRLVVSVVFVIINNDKFVRCYNYEKGPVRHLKAKQ